MSIFVMNINDHYYNVVARHVEQRSVEQTRVDVLLAANGATTDHARQKRHAQRHLVATQVHIHYFTPMCMVV